MSFKFHSLESFEWLGEFWFADEAGTKLPGLLSYSPAEGITLETLGPGNQSGLLNDKARTIYGRAFETGAITLFSALPQGVTITAGATRQKFSCRSAVFGNHFDPGTRFRRCVVELNNLAEFFHTQGFKNSDGYTSLPVLAANSPVMRRSTKDAETGFSISIKKEALGSMVSGELSKVLVLDEAVDHELIGDLNVAVETVLQTHGKRGLTIKRDLRYLVVIEVSGKRGATFGELQDVIWETSGLFELLFLKVVRPLSVALAPMIQKSDDAPHQLHQAAISLFLDNRRVKSLSTDKNRRFSLPMTSDAISREFSEIARRWFAFVSLELNVIFPTLQTHIAGETNRLQHYILLVAAMDQCRELENSREPDRYQWFVDSFGNDHIRELFLDHLPSGSIADDIGKHLGEIRNCIVHPIKLRSRGFQKYRETITSFHLENLNELIFITLVSFVYKRIMLDAKETGRFLKNLDRHIATYFAWDDL